MKTDEKRTRRASSRKLDAEEDDFLKPVFRKCFQRSKRKMLSADTVPQNNTVHITQPMYRYVYWPPRDDEVAQMPPAKNDDEEEMSADPLPIQISAANINDIQLFDGFMLDEIEREFEFLS